MGLSTGCNYSCYDIKAASKATWLPRVYHHYQASKAVLYAASTIKLQLLHPLPQPATQILLTATLTLRTTKKRDRIICLFPKDKKQA